MRRRWRPPAADLWAPARCRSRSPMAARSTACTSTTCTACKDGYELSLEGRCVQRSCYAAGSWVTKCSFCCSGACTSKGVKVCT